MLQFDQDSEHVREVNDSPCQAAGPVLRQAPFIALDGDKTVRHENALAVDRISGGYRVSLAVVDPNVAPLVSELASGKLSSRSEWEDLLKKQAAKRTEGSPSHGYVDGQPAPSLVITVEMLEPNLEVTSCRLTRASDVRVTLCSYQSMSSVEHASSSSSSLAAALVTTARLGLALYKERRQQGDLVFADSKQGFLLNPDGSWEQYAPPEMLGRVAVQEITCKVLEGVAKLAAAHNVPLIYQGCAEANPELRRALVEELNTGRLKTREDIDQILIDSSGRRTRLIHRREYSPIPIRHEGLHLDAYARVSAPLREFVDCVNLQQLLCFAEGSAPLYGAEEINAFIAQVSQRQHVRLRHKGSAKYAPFIAGALETLTREGSLSPAMLQSLIADCRDAGRLPAKVVEYLMERIESKTEEVLPRLANRMFSDFIGLSADLRSAGKWLIKKHPDLVDQVIQLGISSGSLPMQESRVTTVPAGGLVESVWCVDGHVIFSQRFLRGFRGEIQPAELAHVQRIQFAKLCRSYYSGQARNVGKSELAPNLRRLEFELRQRGMSERVMFDLHARRLKGSISEYVFSVTPDAKDTTAVLYQHASRAHGWLEAVESSASEILKGIRN